MSAPARECSTGKFRWSDHERAARALARIQAEPEPGRLYVPTRTFRCPKCEGYHLTSKSPSKPGGRGKRRRGTPSKGRTR